MKKAFPILLALCLLLAGCGDKTETENKAETSALTDPTPTPAPTETPEYTVSYVVNGSVVSSETVKSGDSPEGVEVEGKFRCWLDSQGSTVRLDTLAVTEDCSYTAAFCPELHDGLSLFEANKDGLFHPEDAFTRSDAVRFVYNLMVNKPATEMFLKDVTTSAQCYKAASTLAAAGYIQLDNGAFDPDSPITLGDLSALLEKLFPVAELDAAMAECELPLTRGGAAQLFANLLKLGRGTTDYPDVEPEHAHYRAISALGVPGGKDWGERRGFVHVNGKLYCFDERGYFLKNADVGTLHFGADGAYTSGDATLDALVTELMKKKINPGSDQEENLRKAYYYVRDSYLYLRRNYYEVGETGWEIAEATTMLQSGKGNCYNFTGTFWALARALGYEAYCVSGLVGQKADPHSWVEIPWEDGMIYIFDPETEMSYRLKDQNFDCFKMTYEQGEFWSYYRG